jgi:hypothetical protein
MQVLSPSLQCVISALTGSFISIRIFHFDRIRFVNFSFCQLFFLVLSFSFLFVLRLEYFLLFFSRSFINYPFKSMLHFELCIRCDIYIKVYFSHSFLYSLSVAYKLFQHHSLKRLTFSIELLLLKKKNEYNCMFIFVQCNLC